MSSRFTKVTRLERRTHPLAPRSVFARRLALSVLVSSAVVALSLAAGMAGYHWLENLGWLDAFANAAMILSGMGPLEPLHTPEGKLFAGVYAIYSGFAVIMTAGIVLVPVVHRLMHRFHIDADE